MRRAVIIALLLLAFSASAEESKKQGWLGLNFSYHTREEGGRVVGWMILCGVHPNGPAKKVGLRLNDMITRVNGRVPDARTDDQWLAVMRSFAPGDEVALRVVSGGATRDVVITVGERPSD